MSHSTQPPSYPAIRFITNWGDALAILVAVSCMAVGIYLTWLGYAWPVGVAGVAAGLILWLVLRSYVEVLRILADTLMPR
ncbi:MAG: hypothetical protein P0Y66_13610 [Candidatus Kaistia colombiensis]|nr:MAG: hypothetical protein P0Y66_13610 [Kaistia sp.]